MASSPLTHSRARELRWNMTEPERLLWDMLRKRQQGLRFRRQHPMGPYILDFYCPSARLCVEVDGPSHEDLDQVARDKTRDAWLNTNGVRVVRFSIGDVSERPAAVIAAIVQAEGVGSARASVQAFVSFKAERRR